ncbi:metallophosphoesterase [Haploplasma axanthum]|nr:metallophosphoesterase [Haploplasma axanthum]
MKLLIIHITDLHIKKNTHYSVDKIDDIVRKIKRENIETCIFLFGGDIVNSGTIPEYEQAEAIIDNLFSKIKKDTNLKVFAFFVPGNHDIQYNEGFKRDRDHIKTITSEKYADMLDNELVKFSNYSYFEKEFYRRNQSDISIVEISKLLTKICLKLEDIEINIFMCNNSVYTYFDANDQQFYDNEKGLLLLENDFLIEDYRNNNGINLLLMHYPLEYYNDDSRNRFIDEIDGKINFVFTGHIHSDNNSVKLTTRNKTVFISSGEFSNSSNDDSEFTILTYDSKDRKAFLMNYKWEKENKHYSNKRETQNIEIPHTISSLNGLSLATEFTNEFYYDITSGSHSVLDLYVFPPLKYDLGITKESKQVYNYKKYDDVSRKFKFIIIKGAELSGKTTFLKFLHSKMISDKLMVYLEYKSLNTNKETVIKNEFFTQYGVNSFYQFEKVEIENRIVIIDDFDMVEKKEMWIDKLQKFFGKIILVDGESILLSSKTSKDLKEIIEEDSITFTIDNFYKSKREELVLSVYKSLMIRNNIPNTISKEKSFLLKFENMIKSNLTLFSINPYMLTLLVDYLFNVGGSEDGSNIYSEVFRANITFQLNSVTSKYKITNLNPYLAIIYKLAFDVSKKEYNTVKVSEVENIVENYNEIFGTNILCLEFVGLLKDSRIIKEDGNNLYFASKNYLAFFAAQEYVKKSNYYDEFSNDFIYLITNLFEGVNDKIILFIAFSQQNSRIIKEIIDKTENNTKQETVMNIDEFMFLKDSKDLIGDLKQVTKQDREKIKKRQEKNERQIVTQETKEIKEIKKTEKLDDFQKKVISIQNYTMLISTIFPSFFHVLEVPYQKKLTHLIYTLPNQLLFLLFKDLDDNKNEIIDQIYNEISKEIKKGNQEMIKNSIYQILVNIVRGIMLAVYDDTARRSVDQFTVDKLVNGFELINSGHKIENLMIKSFSIEKNDKKSFEEAAVKLYNESKDKEDILVMNAIKLIVKRYVYDNEDFSFVKDDRKFLNAFFDNRSINEIQKGKNIKDSF